MFGSVAPTPFDFHFSALGIPVRVSPWFWLLAALLGHGYLEVDPFYLATWIVVVFVSILVHELGHALMARFFGYPPQIVLHQFGGVAMYLPDRDYSTMRAILITAAGPAAGLALGLGTMLIAVILVLMNIDVPQRAYMFGAQLVTVNIAWSIMNLMPVLPLDGGRLTQHTLVHFFPFKGHRATLIISMATAALIAGVSFTLFKQPFLGIMFAYMGFMSYSELQQRGGY